MRRIGPANYYKVRTGNYVGEGKYLRSKNSQPCLPTTLRVFRLGSTRPLGRRGRGSCLLDAAYSINLRVGLMGVIAFSVGDSLSRGVSKLTMVGLTDRKRALHQSTMTPSIKWKDHWEPSSHNFQLSGGPAKIKFKSSYSNLTGRN